MRLCCVWWLVLCCFFFNDTATTEIYTLSLHDALPISACRRRGFCVPNGRPRCPSPTPGGQDVQSRFDQFPWIHRPSPGLFNILGLNVFFCTGAASLMVPIHLLRSSILGRSFQRRGPDRESS